MVRINLSCKLDAVVCYFIRHGILCAGTCSTSFSTCTQNLACGFVACLFVSHKGFLVTFDSDNCRNNKIVLRTLQYPITATAYQFFLGSIMGLVWFAASKTAIDSSRQTLKAVAPLAVVHALGNLLTNMSLGMVAVSFTHTIKALEPMFSVLFSFLFLGESANPLVLLTLLPIMGGVIGAAVSEASFNWLGFSSAMASNATFQSRNVFSKKVMTPEIKDRVRNVRQSTAHLYMD